MDGTMINNDGGSNYYNEYSYNNNVSNDSKVSNSLPFLYCTLILLLYLVTHIVNSFRDVRGLSPIIKNKRIINKLQDKVLTYSTLPVKTETLCSICLEDFLELDQISILNCNHIYHIKCIVNWMETETSCPLCRREQY